MAEGRRRRSARISALENEEAKERKRGRKAEAKPPKRGRKRIKVRHVNDIDKEDEVENGEENPNHETRDDKPEAGASQTHEKHLLKHALEVLKKKDAYKIFAVPVDPNVVVGYYEIIKEPMDFLTIDAKLEQGDYKSVDEFERDVYLMLDNAMLFNDSETKYYRQASIIRDFAEKIFRSIRSDPENFESEYRLPKRGRKPKCEVGRPESTVPPAATTRTQLALNVRSQPALATRSQPSVVPRSQPAGAGQRRNGKEWNSFLGDTEALISEISNCPKQLIPVNQGGVSYQDSLMQFVEGMGPTAQRVAKRMLEKFGATGQQGVTPTRDLNLLVPPTAENYRTRTLFETSSGSSSFETLPFLMRNQNNSTLRSQQSLVGQNQDLIGPCRTNGFNFASKVQVSSHHPSDINRMVPTSENHGIGSGQATSGLDPNADNLFQMWRQLNLQL